MSMNMNSLPSDPEDKGNDAPPKTDTTKPVTGKRNRRTKEELDESARELGFKDWADKKEQEGSMGEPKTKEVKEPEEKPSPQPDEEVVQVTVTPTGLQENTRWNLGGSAFILSAVNDDGTLTFTPAIGK